MNAKLILGDCLDSLKDIENNSIDCIATDPPYGLTSTTKRFGKEGSAPAKFGKDGAFSRLSKGFMGQVWDGTGIEYNEEMWGECLRVPKPGLSTKKGSKMDQEELIELLNTELQVFIKGLQLRKFPIEDAWLETDDYDAGEPYIHAVLEVKE